MNCSVLPPAEHIATHCELLCVAVNCSVLQRKKLNQNEVPKRDRVAMCRSVLQCVTECRSVLQCFAVCCSVLQCVAVFYSALQCVAVRCSAL